MLEAFETRRFRKSSLETIERANQIIAEYSEQGFTLNLRQLFYQHVSRGLIDNTFKEYQNLGRAINRGRQAGLIDWDAIEDRTRVVRETSSWDDPASVVQAAAHRYREDLWLDQRYRPQVRIEKDALIGVIEPPCNRYRVPYYAHRGNNSQSEAYKAGKLFQSQILANRHPVVLHLADHDPNGIDMTRDNEERLTLFAGRQVEVRRIALNMDQVEQYRLPPNPAKETDARSAGYLAKYGSDSWELDALDPTVIDALISKEIEQMIDPVAWSAALAQERCNRAMLERVVDRWDEIEELLA